MNKQSPHLHVYLGSLKKAWVEHCQQFGQKPGVVLKNIVEQQLEKKSEFDWFLQTKPEPDNAVKQRFEILLTPSEKAALEARARSEQCSQRRWVIDAIRTSLTKQTQFSMKEIDALGESNYQLLAIVRNLNQIAKVMSDGRQSSVTISYIQQLEQIVDTHIEKVSCAIRASLERWKIE